MSCIRFSSVSSCSWLTLALVGLGLAAARSSEAVSVSPQLGVTARYEAYTRSAFARDQGSGWTGVLDPQLGIVKADAKSSLHAVLGRRYNVRPDIPSPVAEALVTQAVLKRAFTHTASVALEARKDRRSDPLAADFTGVTSRHAKDTRLAAVRFESARAEGASALSDFRYLPGDLPSGHSQDSRAALVPFRSAASAVRVAWRGQDVRESDGQWLRCDRVTLGLNRVPTAGAVAEFEVGSSMWNSRDESARHFEPAFAVGLRSGMNSPRSPVQINLRLARDVFTLWQVEVARAQAGGMITLGWEQEPDYTCTVHPSPTVTNRVRLGVRDTLGQSTILELEGSREVAQPVFFGDTHFRADRAVLALTRVMSPVLAVRTAGQYLSRIDDDSAAHPRSQRMRFELSLLGSMP